MIYYAASNGSQWSHNDPNPRYARSLGYTHGLVSFVELAGKVGSFMWARECFVSGVVLDSGAFGAFTRGLDVDLDAYIRFCHAVGGLADFYANLDVICDHEGTERNQRRMEAAGLKPVPTYHLGEPWEALSALLDEYDHIAIGRGTIGRNAHTAIKHLDYAWKLISEHERWPLKVHGWALSDSRIMERYPWHSVDSTSWIMGARLGGTSVRGRGRHPKSMQLHTQRNDTGTRMRMRKTAEAIQGYQAYVTRLWASRGVVWE